jgi:peptide/nickel transport system permease protein
LANSTPTSGRARRLLRSARTRAGVFWAILRANPLTLVGFVLVTVICVAAVIMLFAPTWLAPYGPLQTSSASYSPPTWQHPLGTDAIGLDTYSEVMYALPLDLGIGLVIAGASMLIGGGLGLVAGYWDRPRTLGGVGSVVILRLTDIFLSFPSLILALAIVAAVGISVWTAILAVFLTWWPNYVRLVRGEVLAVKHLPYIQAAKAAGVSDGRIVLRHVLRNVLEPVIVYFTMDIGTVLVVFSTIGFITDALPYPVQSNSQLPEWGSMLAHYHATAPLTAAPWLVFGPGLAIFVTVLAFSLLGDGLRDVLDPRSRRILASAGQPTGAAAAKE